MSVEFDCSECGTHIIVFTLDEVPYGALCALCLALPGWHESFDLRTIFGEATGAAWPFPSP